MSSPHPQVRTINAIFKKHLEETFPSDDFIVNVDYSYRTLNTVLRVQHRLSGRAAFQLVDDYTLAENRDLPSLIETHMANMQKMIYSDLAAHGHGNDPFEPGNAQHEEIRGLVYLAGCELKEFMLPGAQYRGDTMVYLTRAGIAYPLPPRPLALPMDYWRQLLITTLNKQVANKSDVV